MTSLVNAPTNTAIGMMDRAYFVGRNEILNWLNGLLKLNIAKIEETANGAVACQVMDALFPRVVPMSKVNWGAKNEYEFVQNYKVLQSVCNKLKIDRKIEVERLTRGRYQDNLEFMQWLKKFFELNANDSINEYDAVARRNRGKNVSQYKPCAGQAKVLPTASSGGSGAPKRRASVPRTKAAGRSNSVKPVAVEKENASKNVATHSTSSEDREALMQAQSEVVSVRTELENMKGEVARLEGELADHTQKNAVLLNDVEGLTKERNFYFEKLHEVEILLEDYSGPDVATKEKILSILYEDDVEAASEEGELEGAQEPLDVGPNLSQDEEPNSFAEESKQPQETKEEIRTAREEEKLSDETQTDELVAEPDANPLQEEY